MANFALKIFSWLLVQYKSINKKIDDFSIKHVNLALASFYALTIVFAAVVFYNNIPKILNYAPDIISGGYEKKWYKLYYWQQYIIMAFSSIIIGAILLRMSLIGISRWENVLQGNVKERSKPFKSIERKLPLIGRLLTLIRPVTVSELREKCLILPYIIYIIQVIIPALIACTYGLFMNVPTAAMFKLAILLFSVTSLSAVMLLAFSKKVFKNILEKTFVNQGIEGKKINLKLRLYLQILPMFLVGILFSSLIGYSRIVEEKGQLLQRIYSPLLSEVTKEIDNVSDIKQLYQVLDKLNLKQGESAYFIISPSREITTSDGTYLASDSTFMNYIYDISLKKGGQAYDLTSELQGCVVKIKGDSGDWIVGIKYNVVSNNSVEFMLVAILILFLINSLVILYFSTLLSSEIKSVVVGMEKIIKEKVEEPLKVTSNDEIGDLVVAFNKIQTLEKNRLQQLKDYQTLLIQRERLATLGESAGNVAHDINNPLSGIQFGLATLKGFIEKVTPHGDTEEQKEKSLDSMRKLIDSNLTACRRILELVGSIKNSTRNLNSEFVQDYKLSRIFKDLKIMLGYSLQQNKCNLVLNPYNDPTIRGDASKLYQVVSNIVINASEAYKGEGGDVEIVVDESDVEALVIKVKDYAGGIPNWVREDIFKKMFTTKGAGGTGLGLYMAKSLITGHYGGDLTFEVDEEAGTTTFFVSIPYHKPDSHNQCGVLISEEDSNDGGEEPTKRLL